MAQIPRPPKQGNVTTYVAKVAAGYGRILAGEVDADLDTIYGAWNGGADTVNLRDGAVTSAKLAADSVGPRELQDGGIITANLGDASVTTPKIADSAVTSAKLAAGAVGSRELADGGVGTIDLADGAVTTAKLAAGAVTGGIIVAGSIGSAQLADGGVATADLADAAVTRAKLAPGALPGNIVTVPITAFSTATIGSWVPVATLPALATRGANPVLLFTNHGLSGNTLTTPGDMAIRWVRGGVHLCNTTCHLPSGVSGVPMPSLPWLDVVPSAGAYVYELQVWLSVAGMGVLYGSVVTGCGLLAIELG
jgi:hypothetical protein